MLRPRVIPCLLLDGESLVKTTQFTNPEYIGDPVNTIRIFNELEVDELMLLDINATKEARKPNIDLLETLADECFMPLTYGGGINKFETVRKLFSTGIEKVVVNSVAYQDPSLVKKLADTFGSQSIVGSIDIKSDTKGEKHVYTHGGSKRLDINPVDWAENLEDIGVGELLITSIDREGTWEGLDVKLINEITSEISIPVIAHGGAYSVGNIKDTIRETGASAVAVGSMVVYQKQGMGVLVNFPEVGDLRFRQTH